LGGSDNIQTCTLRIEYGGVYMPEEEVTTPSPTPEEHIDGLYEAMSAASAAHDKETIKKLAREIVDAENALAKAKREALQAAIAGLTEKVKGTIDKAVARMIEAGELDGADGVWYSKDFGDESSGCRLLKSAPKVAGEKSGNGGSYVSHPAKSDELRKSEGAKPFTSPDGTPVTKATIGKVEHTFPDGLTLEEAWKYSNDGGWRNRVRQALLKSAGLI